MNTPPPILLKWCMIEDFLFCIFVQISTVQASFSALYALTSLDVLLCCSVSCLLLLQQLQRLVWRLMTLTIAHVIYFVPSEIQISDYPPGSVLTTLTELSRSGQYCEKRTRPSCLQIFPPYRRCHTLSVNS